MLNLLHQYRFLVKPLRHPSEQRVTLPQEDRQDVYRFGFLHLVFSSRGDDLECDHLTVVPTLPNFGHPGGVEVLGKVALLLDPPEFIRCWDCMVAATQLPKFDDTVPPRPWIPMCELLGRRHDQNWEGGIASLCHLCDLIDAL